ncbi:Phenazine biosynthesis-like domain-containing protein 1 [Oopsacas minuta]|uniref:Phenazine biosynthesis-like domain-containing protein 1 n=1 Tax=Oopsacas minuta TaxID=111878 RepID=A0AAV7JSG6_9METZ|nr:Phenazine biosynthesis-like domain-containing protein 1 [Oopsacas minuta]
MMTAICRKELAIYVVDSFSDNPYSGNPAAVCLVPFTCELTNEDKQKIASEMNHSETAFIQELNSEETFDKSSQFNLQWFTPTCEVSMCGHATLASAYVLFTESHNCNKEIAFFAKCGLLTTQFTPEGAVSMDFPLAILVSTGYQILLATQQIIS